MPEKRTASPKQPILDKALYRDALAQYRRWSERKQVERAEFEAAFSPVQAWERYKALWEFVANSMPTETELQAKQKALEIRQYLARIRKFEKRRHANSKAAGKSAAQSRPRSRKK